LQRRVVGSANIVRVVGVALERLRVPQRLLHEHALVLAAMHVQRRTGRTMSDIENQ